MKLARALNNNLRRYLWSPLLNKTGEVYCFFRFVSKEAGTKLPPFFRILPAVRV